MRDYTKRPYQFTRLHSPKPEPSTPIIPNTPPGKPSSRKTFILIGLIAAGLCALGFIATIFMTRAEPYEKKLISLQQEVSFPLYKPSMPSGYSLDPEDIKNVSGIVFMRLRKISSEEIIEISQQATPNTRIDDLFNNQEPPTTVQTKKGKLVLVESQGSQSGILTTPESWINITTPKNQSDILPEDIANGLVELD